MSFSFLFFWSLFFLVASGILLSIVYWSVKNGISPMPTSRKTKAQLLSMLPLISKGIIYELGCGWGTLAFPLAQKYPNFQVIALETSPIPYSFCQLRLWLYPLPNLLFQKKDYLNASLYDSALIVCYLYPQAMNTLKAKFEKELKLNTWVLSNTFAIPSWKPFIVNEIDDLYHTKIYLYKFVKISNAEDTGEARR